MREIKLLADERCAEALADQLMDAGALSATIEDADADRPDEQPLYGEPGLEPAACAWPRSIVSLLVEKDFDLVAELERLCKELGCDMPEVLSSAPVEDQDWVRLTQAQFPPTQVSDRLWIVPTWHEPKEGALNLRLDPGVAFGTGSHPTTHLCLQWLDANVGAEDRVLDYGCGTGILAIAAKLVGAREAVGTDIDPQAVEAAIENARMNEVVAEFVLPEGMKDGTFEIVVANILANPLKLLAPALLGRVAPGGRLVLSGVLAKQADEVIETYRAVDPAVKLAVWRQEGDWVCIAGTRA
ncbi:50S ribosomal protein L11 methyltransferase [Sutterella megalosphaeroides]|uniref:Ribosomal protein L11 methyltransferase n=1 Tax=Sutterella megalosphaeroides TaxID=2494234 RepID=A0A2Z6I9D9_9BURK|nr:50S ribosomal protein L11 methyltransferase [Sutterella megalosphaeroides]BBF22540.1 ribosomal protein L11 methyltransferase [Sutterella megalosphaeroides]